MDSKPFFLALFVIVIVIYLFAGIQEARGKMTTCRLASQIVGKGQRVCVFVGANNTQ